MILERRHKTDPSPERNYTVASCDRCQAECEESRIPGGKGIKAADQAELAARQAGWIERYEPDRNRRRRSPSGTINLLCPECAAKPAGIQEGRL